MRRYHQQFSGRLFNIQAFFGNLPEFGPMIGVVFPEFIDQHLLRKMLAEVTTRTICLYKIMEQIGMQVSIPFIAVVVPAIKNDTWAPTRHSIIHRPADSYH